MQLVSLEGRQQTIDLEIFGNVRRGAQDEPQIERAFRPQGQSNQVLQVQNAGDMVQIAVIDREAAVAALRHRPDEGSFLAIDGDRLHLAPRRHHLADRALAEVKDVEDDLLLVVLNEAPFGALGDDQLQLLGRHQARLSLGGSNAKCPQQMPANAVQDANRQAKQPPGQAHDPVERQRRARGVGDSQRSRRHLTDDDVKVSQYQDGDQVSGPGGDARLQPCGQQIWRGKPRDDRHAIHGQAQGSQGHDELGGRHVMVESWLRLQHSQHVPGRPVALVGQLLQFRVPNAGNGKFRGHKHGVDQNQRHDHDGGQQQAGRRRQGPGRGSNSEEQANARQRQAEEKIPTHNRRYPTP